MSDAIGNPPPADPSAGPAAVPDLVRELSLEAIRAMREFLDLLEAVVTDPALLAEVVHTGRDLVTAALPPEKAASAIRTSGETLARLMPPEVRRELVAAFATILAPPSRPAAAAAGGGAGADRSTAGTDG